MLVWLFLACSMAGKWEADTSEPGPETSDDSGPDDESEGPTAGELVITELMKNPDLVEDDLGEWFEVTNVGDRSLSLAGLAVEDDDGDGFTVNAWTLDSGARVVFGASTDTSVNGGAPVDFAYDVEVFKLGNDDGAVVLRLGDAVIDVVAYDATFPDEAGCALSLDPGAYDVDDNDPAAAWCSAATPYGLGDRGTPGALNDACAGGPVDTDGDGVEDGSDCDPDDPLVYPGASEGTDGVDDDCDGWVDERPPEPGDLVITEIMKDPDPTDDETGEWFEILNVADEPIVLDGLTVTDAGGTGFTVLSDTILGAGDLYVFGVSADTAVNGGYSPDRVYDVADLRLANGADELSLSYGGMVIDGVAYDGDFPDDSGKSLSLDPEEATADDNDDPSAWCEGDGEYGSDGNEGTPGELNGACG
jgi:hypothetical protein